MTKKKTRRSKEEVEEVKKRTSKKPTKASKLAKKSKASEGKVKRTRHSSRLDAFAIDVVSDADKKSIMYYRNPEKWERVKYKWEPPANFKPFWMRVTFTTAQDGMINGGVNAYRYVGTIEKDKDLRKVFDMSTYDPATVQALATRLAMATFNNVGRPSKRTSIATRLPANTPFELHVRVSAVKGGTELKANIARMYTRIQKKNVEVGKKDPGYRYLRKINNHLAAAFINCLETPKGGSVYHLAKLKEKA